LYTTNVYATLHRFHEDQTNMSWLTTEPKTELMTLANKQTSG